MTGDGPNEHCQKLGVQPDQRLEMFLIEYFAGLGAVPRVIKGQDETRCPCWRNADQESDMMLSVREIDANGNARSMPRPFAESGRNELHDVPLVVEV